MFLLELFTLIAVFVFAISAALPAIKKKFDLFGIAFISFVTSVGGGTIRDIMLGNFPISWLHNSNVAISIGLGILFTFLFTKKLSKLRKTFFWFDTIGIGVSTVLGVHKGLASGLEPVLTIFFGVISAVCGGIIRDTLCNQVPLIFRKEVYATPCIIGAGVYVLLYELGLREEIVMFIAIGIIIILRILAIKFKVQIPDLVKKL